MNITFIQAPLGRQEQLVYPLGIVTLAGTLPETCAVSILDPNEMGLKKTREQLRVNPPDVVCLSIRNLDSQIRRDLFYYYLYLKEFIRNLKSWVPNAVIITGGSGFSLFSSRIMRDNPDIDLGVFLEADEVLPRLIENLEQPENIRGVYYRSDRGLNYTGDPELPAVESFGKPRYDLLDPVPYQANGGVGIQTKRGCPLSCIYCTYPHLNGKCMRMLPISEVISELKELKEGYGIEEVTFVDGIFNLPSKRTVELLKAMNEAGLNIRWRGWFTEIGFTKEMAELCRDTGCPEFSFSPDGFSNKTLKALGKTITIDDIEKVYSIAKETPGIRVAFNFFWNPPRQTLFTWLEMMLFAIKCKLILRERAGGIIFGNARIEPHTPLRQIAIDDGIIEEETDLLPPRDNGLRSVFYSNPSTRYLDWMYAVYSGLWRLKQRIKKNRISS